MGKEEKYQPQAKINTIRATSRVSMKVGDNFYTLEYTEERLVPNDMDVDIKREREALWDVVNDEVDNQITDIYNLVNSYKM